MHNATIRMCVAYSLTFLTNKRHPSGWTLTVWSPLSPQLYRWSALNVEQRCRRCLERSKSVISNSLATPSCISHLRKQLAPSCGRTTLGQIYTLWPFAEHVPTHPRTMHGYSPLGLLLRISLCYSQSHVQVFFRLLAVDEFQIREWQLCFVFLAHRIAVGLEGIKSGMFFATYFSPELVLHTSNLNGFLHLHHPHWSSRRQRGWRFGRQRLLRRCTIHARRDPHQHGGRRLRWQCLLRCCLNGAPYY